MNLSAHNLAIDTFVPMLSSLQNVLGKGAEFADGKKFDVAVLVHARLAADMYTLQQQVQLACHHAKDAVERLTGGESVPFASLDETFAQLRSRVAATIDDLSSKTAALFEAGYDRDIVIALGGEMVFAMKGYQFIRDWAFPHFYFHVVTAYDILRHNGVDVGKRDYAGVAGRYLRPAPAARS